MFKNYKNRKKFDSLMLDLEDSQLLIDTARMVNPTNQAVQMELDIAQTQLDKHRNSLRVLKPLF